MSIGYTGQGDQVVVVTGASGGIGRATALAFAERGATWPCWPAARKGLAGAVRDVEPAGGMALPIPTDVADQDQVTPPPTGSKRSGPDRRLGQRGLHVGLRPVRGHRARGVQRVTEVSYLGYVYGTMAALQQHAAPRPRHHRAGRVGAGLPGHPLQTAYCGAKHAIQGFHEALRCELLHEKSNMHVTMVQMPAVNTPQFSWVLSRLPKPRPAGAADLPARGRRPRRPLRRRPPAPPGVLGRREHDGHARRQRGGARPAGPLPGTDRVHIPAGRPTPQAPDAPGEPVGARRTGRTARTSAHTATSTPRPRRAVPSCGLRSTTACSAGRCVAAAGAAAPPPLGRKARSSVRAGKKCWPPAKGRQRRGSAGCARSIRPNSCWVARSTPATLQVVRVPRRPSGRPGRAGPFRSHGPSRPSLCTGWD